MNIKGSRNLNIGDVYGYQNQSKEVFIEDTNTLHQSFDASNRNQDEPKLLSDDKTNQSSNQLLLNLTNVSSVEKLIKDNFVISGEHQVMISGDTEDLAIII